MKIRESRLQKGIFTYKMGIPFTKVAFHLQNGSLGLQTGLSPCYLPNAQKNHLFSSLIGVIIGDFIVQN